MTLTIAEIARATYKTNYALCLELLAPNPWVEYAMSVCKKHTPSNLMSDDELPEVQENGAMTAPKVE
jgi:hypothetical protein